MNEYLAKKNLHKLQKNKWKSEGELEWDIKVSVIINHNCMRLIAHQTHIQYFGCKMNEKIVIIIVRALLTYLCDVSTMLRASKHQKKVRDPRWWNEVYQKVQRLKHLKEYQKIQMNIRKNKGISKRTKLYQQK